MNKKAKNRNAVVIAIVTMNDQYNLLNRLLDKLKGELYCWFQWTFTISSLEFTIEVADGRTWGDSVEVANGRAYYQFLAVC